jgi:hypothetical protein
MGRSSPASSPAADWLVSKELRFASRGLQFSASLSSAVAERPDHYLNYRFVNRACERTPANAKSPKPKPNI